MATASGAIMSRAQGRDERRAQIARAAVAVLKSSGVARMTARKVAAEAGLSLGHITYNFATMEEVLSEAYHLASDDLSKATDAALDRPGDALGRVSAFLRAGFDEPFLEPGHLRMRIDLWAASLWHGEIATTEAALYARYRSVLLELLARVGGSADDRLMVADTVMAALDGLWLDWMRRRDRDALERGLGGCERLIRLCLAPAGSAGHGEEPDLSPR